MGTAMARRLLDQGVSVIAWDREPEHAQALADPLLAAGVCVAVRLIGVHFGVGLPIAPSERKADPPPS